MEIAITGASGLIGSALAESLRESGHRAITLVRRTARPGSDEIEWDPANGVLDSAELEGIGAVVHLAGAGIGDKRWNEERKRVIMSSRVDGTQLVASTLAGLQRPPSVFVCGSAIGYYGSCGDQELPETAPKGTGFLAEVVDQWEAAAQPAIEAGIRTVFARTAVVLTPTGGVLKRQLPLFKLGLGGKVGPGTQYFPWISLDDEVAALRFLIDSDLVGPVNLAAPEAVTNQVFTETLGRVLNRPTLLPVPLFGPKALFGQELVEALLLASQRVVPEVLERSEFTFAHPTLETALRAILGAGQ